MEIIIGIIIGLALGLIIGILISRQKKGSVDLELAKVTTQLEETRKSVRDLEERSAQERLRLQSEAREEQNRMLLQAKENYERSLARERDAATEALSRQKESSEEVLRQQKENSESALKALQDKFDQTIAKFEAQVKVSTNELLKQRQEEFAVTSRESVRRVLEPLETTIADMKKAVADNTTKHDEFGGRLTQSLKIVMEQSERASKSADNLANVLRGGGRIQGDWGETVLAELLSSQGLTEGVQFETQSTLCDESGKVIVGETNQRMRPDVILHLDSERDVIIDAKVSLTSFFDYMEAEDDEKAAKALKDHVLSLENHYKSLSKKDYSKYITAPRKSVDYVIMFVPYTAALYAATREKPDLWRKAMEMGVYIADEQTLYAALKIVDLTWRNITQAANHQQVFKLANEMLDRVQAFMVEYVKIGDKLKDAAKAYDAGSKKLENKGQSIPTTCGKLVALGAKYSKTKGVPPTLLGLSSDPEEIE